MSPTEHAVEAARVLARAAEKTGVTAKVMALTGGMHLAVAVGDYVGEAAKGGHRYKLEMK